MAYRPESPWRRSRGRSRRRLLWPVAGIALLIAILSFTGSFSGGRFRPDIDRARAEPVGPPVPISVGAPLRVRPVAPGFLGLSLEYRTIVEYAGRQAGAINPVLVALIRSLAPGQRPQLRIGGDSTDRTWWPARGLRKPLGAYIKLTPRWGAVARALVTELDARVILGIDLEADSPATARVEADRLVRTLGRGAVEALELGNEPELYSTFTWYHVGGRKLPGRPPGYDFSQYLQQYADVSGALPRLPLAGPAAGSAKWLGYVAPFVATIPRVRIVTLHRYPLQLCYVPPGAATYPTIRHLLDRASSLGLAQSVAQPIALAHAAGLRVRIDEINTISCGKAPAVGHSFASALWALQTLFALARVGADGVNIHSYVGSPYSLFRFHDRAGAWRGIVYPEYYGMLMFARAAPPRSRLLAATGGRRAAISAWATSSHGVVRVVLINAGRHTRRLSVRLRRRAGASSRFGVGRVIRLLAPSLAAQHGVTLGGQTFGAATTTGVLGGAAHVQTVTRERGAFEVVLPAGSAALLTVG